MPFPPATQSAAMIIGTVLAAAGLNLGVLSLDDPEVEPAIETVEGGATEAVAAASSQAGPAPEADTTPSIVATSAETAASLTEGEVATSPSGPLPAPAEVPSAPADTPPTPDRSTDPVTPSSPPVPAPTPPPAPTQPTTAPETTPAPTTAPQVDTEYLTYEFTGVATIVIAFHDGERLEFWSASREPGWVYRVDDDGPRKVKVKFQRLSDGEEAEFEVKLDDGELKVKQEH